MRTGLLAALLTLPLLAASVPAQERPDASLFLPLTFSTLKPGATPRQVEGSLRVDFPPGTDCSDSMTIQLQVVEKPAYATANLDRTSVTITPNAEKPSYELPFTLSLSLAADAPALDEAAFRVRANLGACGNLAAHTTSARTALLVEFVGKIEATLVQGSREDWVVHVESRSNGPADVSVETVHPSSGKVVAHPTQRFDENISERTLTLPRSGLPLNGLVLAQFRIRYAEDARDPDAAPAAFDSLVLQSEDSGWKDRSLWIWGGVGAAALLLAAGLVGLFWWRRRRRG